MDGRPRNYPNVPGGDARGPPRRPSAGGARGAPSTASASSTPSAMSRAERFDDERRRINESCFAKVDEQGQQEAQRKKWAGEKGFTVTISKPYYWEAGTAKEKEFFIGSMVKIYNKYTKGEFPILTGFSTTELNSLTNGQPRLAAAEGRPPAAVVTRDTSEPRPTRQGPHDQRPMPPKSPGPPPRRPGESPQMSPGPIGGPPNPNFRRHPGEYQGPRRPGAPDDQTRSGTRPGTGDESRRPPPFAPNPNTPSMPDLRQKRSMDPSIRSRPSGDSMRMRPPPMQGREPMPPTPQLTSPTLTPHSSTSEFVNRPRTPESGNFPSNLGPARRQLGDDGQSQKSGRSVEDLSFEASSPAPPLPAPRRMNGSPAQRRDISPPRALRPNTAQSNASSNFTRNEEMPPDEPPQRRRPFMETRSSERSLGSNGVEPRSESQTRDQSPVPPIEVPPRRRPQEMPEGPKPALAINLAPVQQALPQQQPNPPPQLPMAPLSVASEPTEKAPAVQPASGENNIAQNVTTPSQDADSDVAHRPGMGPMIKKSLGISDSASKFRKAAAAAGAFKPRAGGAAAKLFAPKEAKASDEPDGISGVFVPQRSLPKEAPKEAPTEAAMLEEYGKQEEVPRVVPVKSSQERRRTSTEAVPSVTISSPLSQAPMPDAEEISLPSSSDMPPPQKPMPEPEVRRKKRRSNQQITNIANLGIDPSLVDEQGLEFESLLSDLGWGSEELSAKNIESFEADIKRQIAQVEAGSWLNQLEQKDDRVETVGRMLDRAIAECDDLEGLLTLYNVELGSLNDDIAFIEAQSQGLQVQTANQKLLQHELQQLVVTISITPDQLESLRRAPIGKITGLRDIESSLVLLYKALITIDPSFVAGSRADGALSKAASSSGFGNSELATMQALQEKRDRYLSEGAMFLDRLKKHMEITFGAAFLRTKDALANIDQGSMPSLKKNVEAHDEGRNELWMLSPVMLFAKQIDRSSWDVLLRMYQTQAAKLYQQEVRDNILAWRKFARKPTGEEQELLFTTQEKETESITGSARKLTVKRSQTLARGLRSASGDKETKVSKTQDGKLYAFDVFARILEDTGPVLLTEQNFITEFFHATSSDAIDFTEAVQMAPPEARRGPNLWIRKQFEADRAMAKHVTGVMEEIFSFWPTEIQSLVDWAVQADPLQGVGILGAVDRKLVDIEDSNQDFLARNLQKIHERLKGLFNRFLDEQIRAIEDTKVKIKKRKGVIAFMKTFPHFSAAIEHMLPANAEGGDQLEVRRMVNDGYQRMNKAMFESLKVIAKESPTVMASQGQGDPEDKEALNYHILLIENMNHYMEEVDAHDDSVLESWKANARDEYDEHMNLYVDAVIRRPLGKLLEFIESTETLLTQPGASAQSIAQRSSHSRSVFKKLIHAHDAKELRKGIEALKKRVDKHFGDADDPTISRDLVFKVLKECEKKYNDVYDRMIRINQDVYTGEVEIDWGNNEVTSAFRK
ncbi:exocyst complex component Sec3-domain-containing protein [Ampelomyces quisqualis]|uniref:Exocyst complex component Sec3-domain-containing protein n=1 Tax=Ampelomyces quisqualis TaxID=50730 RepID=A0A6A5Q4S7_AMPQU|nr:exocyst complex component Sec3-domain-containing protein [Ampelomyces quisqualis]